MFLRKTLIAIGFVVSVLGFGQDVKTSKEFTLSRSEPYKVVDARSKEYFYYDGNALAIKDGKHIVLQNYNIDKLSFEKSVEISKKEELPRSFVHEEYIQHKNIIYEFFNVWDKPNETEQIFVHQIDINNPKLTNKKLLLKTQNRLVHFGGRNKIDVYKSFDGSKYLMNYRRKPEVRNDDLSNDVIGFMVFNAEMKLLWDKEVTMPYTEAEMDNLGYTVDSKGNAIVLALVKKDPENKHLELLRYSPGSKDVQITKVKHSIDRYFVGGIQLKEGKDNKLYLAGFLGKGTSATGVYLGLIASSGEFKSEKIYDIPLEIINEFKSERAQKKNKKKESKGKEIGLYGLTMDDIVLNPDGTVLLMGEVFYITTTTTTSSDGSTRTTTVYHYKDIFTTKLGVNGELLWMNKMVKNQVRSGGRGGFSFSTGTRGALNYDLSYKYLNTSKYHYFIYMDNVKNLNLPSDKYPARHTSGAGGFLTAYQVNDKTGEMKKLSLFDMKNMMGKPVYQFNTDRIMKTGDNEMVVELYKKKKEDILIKVEIKD